MSNTVSAAAPTDPNLAAQGISASFLTPDALMVYCQSRLDGFDGQIHDIFSAQESDTAKQKALNTLSTVLANVKDGIDHNGTQQAAVEAAFADAIKAVGPDSKAGQQLDEARRTNLFTLDTSNGVTAGNTGDDVTSGEEMDRMVTVVNNIRTDLGASSQLEMIQLQSLMTQRQTAIQLTTNLVQSINDQTAKVVDNVGR